MSSPFRILVSHSTRDTNVRVFWQFIRELQTAIDQAGLPIILVNVVSECGGKIVENLPHVIEEVTAATDITMMVLTQGYIDSYWCDEEMHGRAYSSCRDCPSRRLFPLAWRTYPHSNLWSRDIDGWGVNLQQLITDELLDEVGKHLWEQVPRPLAWQQAIAQTLVALKKFIEEIESTCTKAGCPPRVPDSVPVPVRLD